MKARHLFTPEQIKFLGENVAGTTSDDLAALFNKRFKTDLPVNKIKYCCFRHKFRSGLHFGFRPGVPKKTRPIGTEIVYDKRNFTYVKISDGKERL